MSTGIATRCLMKNTWFLSRDGFKHGYIFVNGTRIEQAEEGDPPPELELSDLLYDFNSDGVVLHGYSLIVDLVEYNIRGLTNIDLSVFSREELKKLAKVGVVNAYTSGVTLPIAWTRRPDIVSDIARENGIRIGLITERGTVSKNPFIVLFEVDDRVLYFEDAKIGELSEVICTSRSINNKCLVLDARGYGNILTAIEEVFNYSMSIDHGYRLLTNPYRIAGIDDGYIEASSASDLVIHDLKNPLKSIPLKPSSNLYMVIARSQQPDVVFIGGDVFYDHGENLAIPVVKIQEIFKEIEKRSE